MPHNVALKSALVALSCLALTVLTVPAHHSSHHLIRRWGEEDHHVWPLPKTGKSKYRGLRRPPRYTGISIAALDAEFGDVITIEAELPEEGDPEPAINGTLAEFPEDVELAQRAVLGGESRAVVTSKAYPFSAIGRLLWSDGTFCTASLVGDRFILTASHCVPWNKPSVSIIWQPNFNGDEVYGHAQVTDIVYIRKNDADNFDSSPCGVYYDHALMRLDTAYSKTLGTLGVTQWNTTLASTSMNHLGYPLDLSGGSKPYMQAGIKGVLSSDFQCSTDGPLTTTADSASGQSGGPLWPPASGTRYIVGTLSASGDVDTVFGTGAGLTSLVAWGKANWV